MTALALASFDHEAPFRDAIGRARDDGRRIVGLWSPLPVEVGDIGEPQAGFVTWAAIAGGLAGAILLYALIWWTATQGYPFDSGNRPLHSWQVFLIAPVEFGALAAGIAGIIALLVKARLTRLHDAAFDFEEVERASSDHFVMAVVCDEADGNAVLALLAGAGAVHSRLATR